MDKRVTHCFWKEDTLGISVKLLTAESRSKGQFIVEISSACQNYSVILWFSTAESCLDLSLQQKKKVRKYSYLPIIKQNSGTFTSVTCTKDTHGTLIFSKQIFINFFKDKQRIPVNSTISGNVGSNILSVLRWKEGKQSIIMFKRERTTIKTPNDSPWV